jgi:hypothetical protein
MPWFMSVFNQSTMEYVVDPNGGDDEGHATRDEAKRELQAWLLSEADSETDEDSAADLDDAAQALNYAEYAQIGGLHQWVCETVEID